MLCLPEKPEHSQKKGGIMVKFKTGALCFALTAAAAGMLADDQDVDDSRKNE